MSQFSIFPALLSSTLEMETKLQKSISSVFHSRRDPAGK
jgi:hypothetical protein